MHGLNLVRKGLDTTLRGEAVYRAAARQFPQVAGSESQGEAEELAQIERVQEKK